MTTDAVTTRSPGRPRGSTIKRLSAVIRARGGARPRAGRKKGIPNKSTAVMRAEVRRLRRNAARPV